MLEMMIVGAALVGGAYLAHKLYKHAKAVVKQWVKDHSGFFSRPRVEQIYAVFEALISGYVGYHVIAQLDTGKLVHVENQQLDSIEDAPKDVRSKLKDNIKKVQKRKMIIGRKRQTEDVYVSRIVE